MLLFIRRRRKKESERKMNDPIGTDGKAEMDNWEVPRKEMATGGEAHELTEYYGMTEIDTDEPEESYELWGEPFTTESEYQIVRKPGSRG
jgi:hypothetical protein